jgi:hypothetical protein
MVRYFYVWAPFVVIGTLCVLALPWLGLIALLVVALGALVAVAGVFVAAPYFLVRAIARRLHAAPVAAAPAKPAAVMSTVTDAVSELSSRAADGFDLSHLWRRPDNTALVVLVDQQTGEEFELVVRDNDKAYAVA